MSKRVPAYCMNRRYALRRRLYQGRQMMKSAGGNAIPDQEAQAAADASAEELKQFKEAVVRQRAEFDNFRKRTQREKDQIRESAAETLLAKLLPVLDNMDRALSSINSASDIKSVREGVNMIVTQFRRTMEAEGLKQVEALNERFDPNLHDALAAEENADVAAGHIFEVLLPGYAYKEKLLRPAMVKVAKASSGEKVSSSD